MRRSLSFLVLTALLAGCPRPTPDFGPEPYREAAPVLDRVQETRLDPEALIADARVRLAGPAGRGSADHFIVVRLPGDLRFETLSFFGNPIALMLVREDLFILWDIDAGEAWEGPPSAETIGMFLPIFMEPEMVAEILIGSPPLLARDGRLDLDHERRRYWVTLEHGGRTQHVLVRPDDFTIEEVTWFDQRGRFVSRLSYDRYRTTNGGVFPHEVRYESADGTSLRVLYRDITFDPPEGDLEGLFEGRLPDHVRVRPVDPRRPPPLLIPEGDEQHPESFE